MYIQCVDRVPKHLKKRTKTTNLLINQESWNQRPQSRPVRHLIYLSTLMEEPSSSRSCSGSRPSVHPPDWPVLQKIERGVFVRTFSTREFLGTPTIITGEYAKAPSSWSRLDGTFSFIQALLAKKQFKCRDELGLWAPRKDYLPYPHWICSEAIDAKRWGVTVLDRNRKVTGWFEFEPIGPVKNTDGFHV